MPATPTHKQARRLLLLATLLGVFTLFILAYELQLSTLSGAQDPEPQDAHAEPASSASGAQCQLSTYQNKNIGIEFTYPSVWGNPHETSGLDSTIVSFREFSASDLVATPSLDYLVLRYGDESNKDGRPLTIRELIDARDRPQPGFTEVPTTLNNISATLVTYLSTVRPERGSGVPRNDNSSKPYAVTRLYALAPSGRLLTLTYGRPRDEAVPCSFNDVVNSFTFTKTGP